MRKLFAAFLAISFLVSSCKTKQAFNFSEDIVKKEKALEPMIMQTDSAIEKYAGQLEYDSMVAVSQRMESRVQQAIDEIQEMPADGLDEGQNFKDASLKYFGYIKSIYTSYRKVSGASSDEERQGEYEGLMALVQKKEKVLQEMRDAQEKFAKANGFRLESKP